MRAKAFLARPLHSWRFSSSRFIVLSSILLSIPTWCFTQAPQPVPKKKSNIVRLNRAPISNSLIRVHIPAAKKVVLSNGVRVLYIEDHRFPIVNSQLVIEGAGGLFDPSDEPGLASTTAQLMRQGTTTRTSKQLAEQIEDLGANINVFTGSGSVDATMSAIGLSHNFDQWFGIATDVLLHPNFPKEELDQLKQRIIVNLRQQRANPGFLANERFSKVVYRDHPARVVSPTEDSINSLTAEKIVASYHERYAPQNAILVFAGDVYPAKLTPKLNQWLAEWRRSDLHITLPPDPSPQTASHVFLVDRPGSVQTNLLLGNIAIDRRDTDYIPLVVMNEIFGGSTAARLFMNLREDKGYTYGAFSRVQAGEYRGVFLANSEVRSATIEGAMTEFLKEFQRITTEPVPEEELRKAERSIVARFALSLETPSSLIGYALTAERFGFPSDYWDKYSDQVMSTTAADVQRVAKKYADANALQIVAVGDAQTVQPIMAKWGSLEVYSADGALKNKIGAH